MNQEEYQQKKEEIELKTEDIIPEFVKEQEEERLTEEKAIELIKLADELAPIPETTEDSDESDYKPSTILKTAPELKDFIQSKRAIQYGTKARIPIPLDLDGQIVKVYVRAIDGEELIQIQEEAERTNEDPNHVAACHACTDAEGNPYSPEELKALGYARERLIGEAITIASGENSNYTTEKIQERAIENLING